MGWDLENPRKGIDEVLIRQTHGEKWLLFLKLGWMSRIEAVDNYLFPSDSAAKRYFSTHYQSLKSGHDKPKWVKEKKTVKKLLFCLVLVLNRCIFT